MLKKIGFFILLILISIVVACIFGFLHNQISYSISPEFFTKSLFERFGFVDYGQDAPRLTVGLIGAWSTWWFGLILGVLFGLIGIMQQSVRLMIKSTTGATIRTLAITSLFGLLGIIAGFLGITSIFGNWTIPENVVNQHSYMIAGTMHNFSYIGGVIGMLYGIVYQIKIIKASAQQ